VKQPENQSKGYSALFSAIDDGTIKIPQFQRDFVWDKTQTARLIDSIIKGFPIGTFVLWRTSEELRHVKNIGNVALHQAPKGEPISYILDGQQRITSLYAVRKGVIANKNDEEVDYRQICINLELEPDQEDVVVSTEPDPEHRSISLFDLLNQSLHHLVSNYNQEELKKIDIYRTRLQGYNFSVISIDNYPIDIACEVFTRINTGGQELTLFEIMVAKTFDQAANFDLAKKYEELVSPDCEEKNLSNAGFETVPDVTVLQCVSAYLRKQIKSSDILKIKRQDFIDAWPKVVSALYDAVDFVRADLRIPVSGLIPYPSQLIPLTYFFGKIAGKKVSIEQKRHLRQLFYWSGFTNRYTSAVESKMAKDLSRVDDILAGNSPSYQQEDQVDLTLDQLKYRWFRTGDAFSKTLLCIFAYHQPKSFESNAIVHLDNSWLKQSNSKNYHHIFPRAYLAKQGIDYWKANSIVNIAIVDDSLNKKDIRAKAPSVYMRTFSKKNDDIANTMKTHLIGDLNEFGIADDNYELFLEKRAQWILKEIRKRVPQAEAGETGEPAL
jgi:hypothetical protein